MKKRPQRVAINCFGFILAAGLAVLTVPLRAGEVFQEDFEEGWANDPETKQLGPDGGWPSNWAFRGKQSAAFWSVVDSGGPQKKVFEFKGGSFNGGWWIAAAQHDVVCPSGKTLQLDGWIREAETPLGAEDVAYLWLSTLEQNGYGITVRRSNRCEGPPQKINDGNNYAGIFKFRDSTVKFGEQRTPGWTNLKGDLPDAHTIVESASDEYLHFFLRLKQTANGTPVEIALYYNTTDSSPVMTWTDDGKQFGDVIDLENLTWVGITAENGKIPHPIQFDAIRVGVIP